MFVSIISWRHLQDMSSRHLQDMPSRRLQDMSSRLLQDMSSRRLQDVFKTSLQDVFKASSTHLQEVLEGIKLLCWRRVEDVFKTNKYLLGLFYRAPLRNCLFYVHIAEFEPADTVKNYFTGAFQTFYTRASSSHSKAFIYLKYLKTVCEEVSS